jgi:hypothetical protein
MSLAGNTRSNVSPQYPRVAFFWYISPFWKNMELNTIRDASSGDVPHLRRSSLFLTLSPGLRPGLTSQRAYGAVRLRFQHLFRQLVFFVAKAALSVRMRSSKTDADRLSIWRGGRVSFWGAVQGSAPIAEIDDIARHPRDRKEQMLPRMNADGRGSEPKANCEVRKRNRRYQEASANGASQGRLCHTNLQRFCAAVLAAPRILSAVRESKGSDPEIAKTS